MSWLAHDQYPTALATIAALRKGGRPFAFPFDLATTHGSNRIAGLRIHGSTRVEVDTRGVLIIAGAHAREMTPPEAALAFADKLCNAYAAGTGVTFGSKTYPNTIVNLLVEALNIYVVPLLNVDGRAYVESTDQSWRKNRRPGRCRGVDLNRNHDFLFDSGIGTSSDPCDYEIYRGPNPHSEAETQGIRDLLDAKPHIKGVLDCHAFTGLVLYPWGDDENQSSDASMSFLNPAWDGLRGFGGDRYREHIAARDLGFYQRTAIRMRDRCTEVAGRVYTAKPSYELYPTSGTLDDYGYARHLASPTAAKAMSMTIEIGLWADGFRPTPESAAQRVRMEGAVLILEFCLAIVCAGDVVIRTGATMRSASEVRSLRDAISKSAKGAQYTQWLHEHGGELVTRLAEPTVADATAALIDVAVAWSRGERELDARVVRDATRLLGQLARGASPDLRRVLATAKADLARIEGQPFASALTKLRAGGATKRRVGGATKRRTRPAPKPRARRSNR